MESTVHRFDVDHLFLNATVVPSFETGEVLDHGFVAVTGQVITAIGAMTDVEPWLRRARRRIDAADMVVMPGLVNVHTHLAAGVFRGLLDEGSGGRGLYDIAFPMEQHFEPEDIYWLGLLGCIEVVKAGCTTVNDIYFYADSLATAVDSIGLRAVLAEKVFDANLARIGQGDYTRDRRQGEAKLTANIDLVKNWHGAASGRITCRIGTHATDTCSRDLLLEAASEAKRLDVGIHIHVAQSAVEMDHIESEHGLTPIAYLNELGMLGPETLTVHCSNNTDADLALMAQADAAYACCPTMYPRRGRFPRLEAFRAHGIRTGFGTDWIRMDPWEGMRNAMCAVRLLNGDPDALPSSELLALQTMGSARALGMESEIGSLAPGKKADITVLNMRRPHLQPFYGGLPGILHTVYPSDVHTVMVDGQIVMHDGVIVNVDEATVVSEVAKRIPRFRAWREALVRGS